jgi:hypothetical protein
MVLLLVTSSLLVELHLERNSNYGANFDCSSPFATRQANEVTSTTFLYSLVFHGISPHKQLRLTTERKRCDEYGAA